MILHSFLDLDKGYAVYFANKQNCYEWTSAVMLGFCLLDTELPRSLTFSHTWHFHR